MSNSILTTTKKALGITEDYTVFDVDILMHINTVFSTLNQLGIGPTDGFVVEDETAQWEQFLGLDPRRNAAKTYTYLRVRLLFDPPTTSYHITAIEKQIEELGWRLNVQREEETWAPVAPVIDGGSSTLIEE